MSNGIKIIMFIMVNLINIVEANLYTLTFIVTSFLTYILILLKPLHIKFSQDQISGPQKFMIFKYLELEEFQFLL